MAKSLTDHPHFVAGVWTIDPAHSELSFTVRHLVVSKVRGLFGKFDVTVVTDENPDHTKVEATVDVASVDTRNDFRDNHLRTSDFFLVEEFPTATFVSTGGDFEGNDFTLHGDLTLRGVTKPITLTGEFYGIVTNGSGKTVAAASATTTINRLDFGVNWNAALEAGGMTLGDDVAIAIELQVIKQD